MPVLTVDNIKVEVPEGTTVLDACRQAARGYPLSATWRVCRPSAPAGSVW